MVSDTVELIINGEEVAIEHIQKVNFNDEQGVKSDKVTITVVPDFPRPKAGAKVEVIFKSLLKDKVIEELNCGYFHVKAVTRTNNKFLSITATGVEFNAKQKEKISHHFENTKLSNIIHIIGKRLRLRNDFRGVDPFIISLYQTNESDIHFLERIAKDYNVLFSIKNDILYFVNKNNASSPARAIDVESCSSSSLKHTDKTYFKSCEASWHSVDDNKIISVVVGEGEPVFKIKNAFKDTSDAKVKAQAKLDSINKGTVHGSFSLKGIKMYAGQKVSLFNTYEQEDDGAYSVSACSHIFSRASGWVSTVEIEN